MVSSRKDRLQGVIVSLPTFNDAGYNLQLDRSKKHIQWLIEHGVGEGNAVLMIAGGLGEGYFLDDEEWRAMADTVVEAADGKVPTMIGLFELSARVAVKKAKYAANAGVDFLQMAPPHYMVPSENDVFGHYQYVNDSADIGIMAYNVPWAMPKPGFEFSQPLIERFLTLENVAGIKWSSHDVRHYVRMLRLFSDKLRFIDNMGGLLNLGPRLGMSGFVDFQCNVAPGLSLRRWEMIKQKRFDELDEQEIKLRMDPFIKVVNPEEASWVGMGEGPTSRLRLSALGMDSGPEFPAQAPLSEAYVRGYMRAIEASGVRQWVEWDQSVFDELESAPARAGAAAD
jgi:4-hydroxy-tetrahydrodipicolinate synthase